MIHHQVKKPHFVGLFGRKSDGKPFTLRELICGENNQPSNKKEQKMKSAPLHPYVTMSAWEILNPPAKISLRKITWAVVKATAKGIGILILAAAIYVAVWILFAVG